MDGEIMGKNMFKKIILFGLVLILQPVYILCMKESNNNKYIGVYLISSLEDTIIKLKNDIAMKNRELKSLSKLKKSLSTEIEKLKKDEN